MKPPVASSQPDRPAPAAPELPEILAAIRAHEVRRSSLNDPDAPKRRAAAEIVGYLGSEATTKVFETVSPDCGNLLTQLHPLLSLFLGRRAAGRLESHVIDAAVVRI